MMIYPRSLPDNRPSVENVPESTYRDEVLWGTHCEVGLGLHEPYHQGREIIAIVPLENGAFCTIFSENFHKF
jgi:hypothetical protein